VYSIGSDEGVLVESELWESEERVWRWMALAGLSCRRKGGINTRNSNEVLIE